jgi:glycosyltransferase involved in cell wall biosynthesis
MKKKILLLSDDLRMTSGIATVSKELVLGTVHKYDWVQLGSAINHPEIGKIVDMNNDIRKRTGVQDADVKIIPYNGYGDILMLRRLIKQENPDAILHFTDPHYWQWLYDNEHEIRQEVPVLFYHIWDDLPDPKYNRDYYESCDWIGCISKQTYGIVHRVGKLTEQVTYKPLQDWQISYVPHGINPNIFKPTTEEETSRVKELIFGDRQFDFVLFYNNRNIRRKQPADVIYSFKLFCDRLPKEKAERCLLLMHTTPVDTNGTDLNAVVNDLCPDYYVKFTNMKVEPDVLNHLYNTVDCTINIANNEGFGLTTAESLMAGTPIIANVTGGLQDQMGLNEDGKEFTADDYVKIGTLHDKTNWGHLKHGEWVVPVWSSVHNINGSPTTPYIFDDRVNNNNVADAIMKVYNWSKDERKRRGLLGREFMLKNLSNKIMCDNLIVGIETVLKNYTPKKKFEFYKIV